ncbi:alpha/beta hydrolase [Persicirhabdus sediminis]|uniref:Alpha/beta hydrolase n=1 Tax=Persicirhabdus sediminis TaxID=454144 RepID=A0A8J7SIH2_9BACT|nr:alpha/beta hydrolase [Persicirhabdus sediminis]MBK1789565.1 alpha/beta hydrolase [Persicirhabdus sediminis]
MKHKLITLVLGLFAMLPASIVAEWQPAEKSQRENYAAVMQLAKSAEPLTNFFAAEKLAVPEPNDVYYQARWDFLNDCYYVNPGVARPSNAMKSFLDICDENELVNHKRFEFKKAAETLGVELISDKVAFEVDGEAIIEHRDLSYQSDDEYSQKLDLFLPKNPSSDKVPCIIFIHGGGWRSHKRAWMEGHAKYVASQGYAAATIDYRMLNCATPLECLHDAKAAVRWVRAHAAQYGIDPDRLGASGGSAGAQLSTALATTNGVVELEGEGGNQGVSSAIQAAVGFATPAMTGKRKTWPNKKGNVLPDWFMKVSPYHHVSADDAPIKFIHGAKDGLVKVEEAKDMFAAYQKLGIMSELEILPDEGHVFYMDEESAEKALAFFRKVFEN